jgi:NAD(P)H-dependent FMN reductase
MTNAPVRLAVIVGSIRDGRFGPTVATWFTRLARERDDFEIDVIDLADHALPTVISATPDPEGGAALGEVMPRVEAAEAFVIVTPEYNHSYPAALKNFIDWHNSPWHAKPVAFVSYGGMAGGLRAVEGTLLFATPSGSGSGALPAAAARTAFQ